MSDRPSPEAIDELFRSYRATKRRSTRNELVEIHIGLAQHIAARFHNRGVPAEDLRQIALLALVKAVDRFDPDHGAAFSSFAGRTIEGELKRYFRDATWAVRVPRSAKELHLEVRRANDELSQTLQRSPTVAEVADHLDVDRDDVVAALAASSAYNARALDRGTSDDDIAQDRSAVLGDLDSDLESVTDRVLAERLVAGLDERSRTIVELRFQDGMTQSEIAEVVGISQMHVSRLLRRALDEMRERSAEVDPR